MNLRSSCSSACMVHLRKSAVLVHFFGDEDGIQCGAPQKLITAHKELDSVVTKCQRLADSSNFDIVAAGRGQRHGVSQCVWIIFDKNTGGFFQDLGCQCDIGLLFGFQNNDFGVCADGRDAHGRTTDRGVLGEVANLSCFPSDLHFFLCVSVFLEFVNLWNDIERERIGKDFVLNAVVRFHVSLEVLFGTLRQFVHARLTGSAACLVGRHQDFLDSKFLDQWPQGHQSNCCGTVGIGDQLGFFGGFSVDFGNDQGNIWFVAEGRGIINDNGTVVSLTNGLGVCQGKVSIDGQKDDVAFSCSVHAEQFDFDIPAILGRHGFSGGSRGTKEAKLVDLEDSSVLEAISDFFSNGTRGTDDSDRVGIQRSGGSHGLTGFASGDRSGSESCRSVSLGCSMCRNGSKGVDGGGCG
mmetsp:Transcript_18557/g.45994  ORF Transcript_18557/g.45994 Transcript_18557/m.45994 type:complete len:409 (-) Transcript_18557:167-1393(-)